MSNNQKSRLGQLLIDKGLVTVAQLDNAIKLQLTGNKRLGEILVEQGVLTERQLNKALKKQTNLRLTATLVAALLSPFQMASANIDRSAEPSSLSQLETPRGMQALSDNEMSSVSAQGLNDVLQGIFAQASSGSDAGTDTASQLAKLVLPVLDSLQAETSMQNVQYDTSKMTSIINSDGSINVRYPAQLANYVSTTFASRAPTPAKVLAAWSCKTSTCRKRRYASACIKTKQGSLTTPSAVLLVSNTQASSNQPNWLGTQILRKKKQPEGCLFRRAAIKPAFP